MRTWVRSAGVDDCGNCCKKILADAAMLLIEVGTVKRYRCQPCGEHMFGEASPAVIEAEVPLTGPQPTLGLHLTRGPDFVTPGQVARSSRFNAMRDAKMRATGEEG